MDRLLASTPGIPKNGPTPYKNSKSTTITLHVATRSRATPHLCTTSKIRTAADKAEIPAIATACGGGMDFVPCATNHGINNTAAVTTPTSSACPSRTHRCNPRPRDRKRKSPVRIVIGGSEGNM